MEKIQAAIQKARVARESGQAPAPLAPPPDLRQGAEADRPAVQHPVPINGPVDTPVNGRAAAPAAEPVRSDAGRMPPVDEAEIAARWAALPAFRPNARRLVRNRIVALEGGAGATEISILRTRILQQMRANGWRRLAITSPGPSCGKTTLALNLGFALSRQPDQRTMVLETDFRRPSIARTLSLRDRHSLARVLGGEARFEDNVVRYGPNLAIASTSGSVRDPAELLQGSKAAEVLAAIEEKYRPTVLLFDLPPMQACDDAMAIMERMDCVLLVAAAGSTSVAQIDSCERDLSRQTSFLGVVLNKCRYMDREDSYNY